MIIRREDPEPPPDFDIDRETLAHIVLKALAYSALVAPDDPSDASDAVDDRFVDALEDERDNPAEEELRAAISGLDVDARTTLVALAWMGRGDFEPGEWREAISAARARSQGSGARYLMGMPLLADYLSAGADALGINLSDEEYSALSDPDIDTRGG